MATEDLIHFKKGYDEKRNYKGRPKGVTSLSQRVKRLLGDEKLFNAIVKTIPNAPDWLNKLENKDMAEVIIMAMATKAMSGDVQSAAWIRKAGYGDLIDFTSDDKPVRPLYVFNFNREVSSETGKGRGKPKAKRIAGGHKKPEIRPDLSDRGAGYF